MKRVQGPGLKSSGSKNCIRFYGFGFQSNGDRSNYVEVLMAPELWSGSAANHGGLIIEDYNNLLSDKTDESLHSFKDSRATLCLREVYSPASLAMRQYR